jgi:acyl dehydratase
MEMTIQLGVTIGEQSEVLRHTISAQDVLQFADVTGDHEPIHVDDEFARSTPYGKRLVHGVFLLGLMADRLLLCDRVAPNVSYGYDKIRFLRPVPVDSTVLLASRVLEVREERREVVVEETCSLEDGTLAAVAHHIFKFI